MTARAAIVGTLGAIAVVVAYLLLPQPDTGPNVQAMPVVARSLPARVVPVERAPPRARSTPPPTARPSWAPPSVTESEVTDGVTPRSEAIEPAAARFVGAQASQRVGYYESMFYSALQAIPEGADADEAREILAGATDRLRDVARGVAEERMTFPESVTAMAAVRDEAADAIEPLVDPDVFEVVSLRLGATSSRYP